MTLDTYRIVQHLVVVFGIQYYARKCSGKARKNVFICYELLGSSDYMYIMIKKLVNFVEEKVKYSNYLVCMLEGQRVQLTHYCQYR